MKRALFDVAVVDVGDLVLAAARWLEPANAVEDGGIVKVNANYRELRQRLLGLLFDAHNAIVFKNGHAEALWVFNFLQHYHRAFFLALEGISGRANIALNDVVAQHHANLVSLSPWFSKP